LSVGQKKSWKKKLGEFGDDDTVQGYVAVSTPLLSTGRVCRLTNETVHTLRKVLRRWELEVESKSGLIGDTILSEKIVAVPRRLRSNPRGAVAPL
jgi:hypothetical protein